VGSSRSSAILAGRRSDEPTKIRGVNTVHLGYMPPMLNSTSADECADKIARDVAAPDRQAD
jgi:hypothetical protein